MLYIILGVLIVILILNWMPRREGATTYQDYDETSCLALANQNQKNIEALQADVTKLLDLQTKLYRRHMHQYRNHILCRLNRVVRE